MGRLPHVEQLALQREHTVVVAAHHAESRDSQRLGGVALRQDERAVHALEGIIIGPGWVGGGVGWGGWGGGGYFSES